MEKPDFKSIASKFYYDNHNLDTDQIVSEAMEYVWSSHVEPLQKENESLKEENTGLINMLMQANAELHNITRRGN